MKDMLTDEFGETGSRILIAAESLFAQHGFDGISLRQITAKAGVNLAAVNYHYSDKRSLCRDILLYRLREINRVRLDNLNQAEAHAGGSIIPLDEIITIMARPLFQPGSNPMAYNAASIRLLGRIITEPLPFTAEIVTMELQPVMTRFGQAIRRHVPGLSPSDFLWRFSLVIGAMHHAMATLHDMKTLTNGICRNDDTEGALRNFTAFAFRALAR
jgi:AcrR family transcriptional regulator